MDVDTPRGPAGAELANDLKPVYTPPGEQAALDAFAELSAFNEIYMTGVSLAQTEEIDQITSHPSASAR